MPVRPPRPRERIPVSAATLSEALWRVARGAERGGAVEQLRGELRGALAAAGVTLTGSARQGLRWIFDEVAKRRPGGEVLVWNYNFFAIPGVIRDAGLVPVFVDAADPSGEPSLEAVERAITPRTAALLVSHHFGRPATMARWVALAERHQLALVEDAAHAYGAHIDGRSVGLFGLGGVFSLSLTKGLTGVAGGVLATARPALAEGFRARERAAAPAPRGGVAGALLGALLGKVLLEPASYAALIHAGNVAAFSLLGVDPIDRLMTERPSGRGAAAPCRLAAAHASVALDHLPRVAGEIEERRRVAAALIGSRRFRRLALPRWEDDRFDTYLNFVVRTSQPRALRIHLLRAGFDTRGDYLGPLDSDRAAYPVSTRLAVEGVYLPIRSLGRERERRALVDALVAFDRG